MRFRAPVQNPELQANFEQLEELLSTLDTGIRFGVGEFSFSASVAIDKIEVKHGLGVVPKHVSITVFYAEDGHECFASLSSVHPPTATAFTFGVRDASGVATSAAHKYWWMAIA